MTSNDVPFALLDAYLEDDLTPVAHKRVVSAVLASRTTQGRLKELQLVKRLLAAPAEVPVIDVADAVMESIAGAPLSRPALRPAWSLRTLLIHLRPLLRCASLSFLSGMPDARVAVNVLDPTGGAWFGA